ncbi:MAG: hypothetical protein AAF826_00615 [Pseudomonadota bacterium]
MRNLFQTVAAFVCFAAPAFAELEYYLQDHPWAVAAQITNDRPELCILKYFDDDTGHTWEIQRGLFSVYQSSYHTIFDIKFLSFHPPQIFRDEKDATIGLALNDRESFTHISGSTRDSKTLVPLSVRKGYTSGGTYNAYLNWIDDLRRSHTLFVNPNGYNGLIYKFDLSGVGAALDAFETCFDEKGPK